MQEQICKLTQRFDVPEMKTFLESFVTEYISIGDSDLYGGKHWGSNAEQAGAKYIYDRLCEIGIDAEMLPFQSTRFQFNDSEIIYDGQKEPIKPYACMTVPTPEEGVNGVLIDVGDGQKTFYTDHDVRGKIVLIETKEDFEDGTILYPAQ